MLDHDPRRQHQRISVDAQRCSFGEVLDLSSGGMRVMIRGKQPLQDGDVGVVKVAGPEGSMTLTCRAVWTKRRGLRQREMGFAFVQLTAATRQALANLARFGCFAVSGSGADASTMPPADSAGPAGKSTEQNAARGARLTASFDMPDFYDLLGVRPDADGSEIKQAYRDRARLLHPDVNPSPEATQRFSLLNQAWETLRDPTKRQKYDIRRIA